MGFWRDFWAAVQGRPNVCDKHDDEHLDISAVLSDVQADVAATRLSVNSLFHRFDRVMKELQIMGAPEDAAYESLTANIAAVKDGWAVLVAANATKDARIVELEAALASADADAAANLATALDADSEADAAKVEAADAAIAALVAPPVEPTPEPQPEPAPVDEAPADDDLPPAA